MTTNKTQIAMTDEQWNTVIDAVNDKYPDSDCMDILITFGSKIDGPVVSLWDRIHEFD